MAENLRYRSYPVTHFSFWRLWVHFVTVTLFVKPMVRFYRPLIYGRHHVPQKGPLIVAANHISMLDPPLISLAINRIVAYMAKKELFKNVLAAEFFRLQGTFSLDRDKPDSHTLKTAMNVLKSNSDWCLGLFPEGTRNVSAKGVLPLKKGIGGMAHKFQIPILPVGITKDDSGRFVVTVGEVIQDLSDPDQIQESVYNALVHLTDLSWKRA